MKSKLKVKEIRIPIYNSRFKVLVGDASEATKYIKGYKTIGDWSELKDRTGMFIPSPAGAGFIFMHKYNAKIFIHEILHATTYLFQDRGIEISYKNDETMAYMIEYIYAEYHKKPSSK
jgi:hypothetical protein